MTDVRAAIVNWGRWGVAHEPQIHYQEIRPMPLTSRLPLTTDCSGFVTLCYYLAGAPDPNGLGYNHQGYTGSELSHGHDIEINYSRFLNNAQQKELHQVLPGDVVVYGPGNGWHTALIVENDGSDPLTVSHGQESGPKYVRVSQDGRLPQTYLRFATNSRFPDPPKPPVLPPAEGSPKPADITKAHLVGLKNGTQAQTAIRNGWHLYYWSKTHFVAQIAGQPQAKALFANVGWRRHV